MNDISLAKSAIFEKLQNHEVLARVSRPVDLSGLYRRRLRSLSYPNPHFPAQPFTTSRWLNLKKRKPLTTGNDFICRHLLIRTFNIGCYHLFTCNFSRKTKGNEFYMAKSYQPAIAAYTKAINLDSTNAALLTNRAAASLMLQLYNEAIQDCNAALVLDSSNSKAYFRKATALKGLGKLPEAIAALNKGLEFDPLSKTALADKSALLSAQEKIAEIKNLLVMKQYQMALRQIEIVTKEVGSTFRDFNILKVEALLELNRPEEAYNLSNLMV